MAKVIPTSRTPKPLSNIRRNGNGRAPELRSQAIPFYDRKLASYSIHLNEQLHACLPRDEITVRPVVPARRLAFFSVGHAQV